MLLDQFGNEIKKPKKEDVWMPYHEYVLEQYFRGKATKEEYDAALEAYFLKQKEEADTIHKEWKEKQDELKKII
jgi:hypothetical protein